MSLENNIGRSFESFVKTIAMLRDPVSGCPWDLQQDFNSLQKYILEEAYEACAAMNSGDSAAICEELGDVLLQVVLNSQVAADDGRFSIAEVIRGINEKMLRRHPHVFSDCVAKDIDSVKANWDKIKQSEKKSAVGTPSKASGIFASIKTGRPATSTAFEIGKIAEKCDFDWDDPRAVIDQLQSELDELRQVLACPSPSEAQIYDELGDLFFTLSQVSRKLGIDSEVVSAHGNQKFLSRFAVLEQIIADEGTDFQSITREEKEVYWQRAKEKS